MIGFIPKEEQGGKSVHNVASFVGKENWATSSTGIFWHCHWHSEGFSRQKPAVHLETAMVILPGRADFALIERAHAFQHIRFPLQLRPGRLLSLLLD